MGRQAIGEPNEFSLALVAAVDGMRMQRALTVPALVERSGLGRNYYYKRTRGELPFSTNDIQVLADALGVSIRALLEPAVAAVERQRPVDSDRPEPAVLGYRLRKLVALHAARRPELDVDRALISALAKRGRLFSPSTWDKLLAGEPSNATDADLAEVADYFGVTPDYLLRAVLPGTVDVLDARLEVEVALAETGAGLAARSVNGASPQELLAIAEAIRRAGSGTEREN